MLPSFLTKVRVGLSMAVYNTCGMRRPLTSHILVTKNCNLDCKMCFVYPLDKAEKIRRTKEPTFAQIKYLIDESCRLGAQVIIPFGGEPLLRKDLGDIIEVIKKRNRYCILYTNGTCLEERLDDVAKVDQLVISIDGDETTNDRIRGQGVYKKALRALELALNRRILCRLHTCLIPDTLDTLDHMAALSKRYNVMLNYGYCDATALTKPEERNISLDRNSVIEFLKKYLQKKKDGIKISTPVRVIEKCIRVMEEWPVSEAVLTKETERQFRHLKIPRCALHMSNIYIDSDGSVYPCLPLWGKDEKAPNVYNVGLKKAWDYYDNPGCHQCASIFTIEKSLFYAFDLKTLWDFIAGYEFLK